MGKELPKVMIDANEYSTYTENTQNSLVILVEIL